MVDEGQRILNQDILGRAVVDLASTIRKWNGILGFATNNPAPLWQTPYGQGIWATMPIKAFLRLEKNQATEAAQALKMPGAVTRALSDIPERQVIMRLWHDHWTSVRALVPPDEETLYQTRGLRPTH
jgi:type IV secretory pathway VirB4 component